MRNFFLSQFLSSEFELAVKDGRDRSAILPALRDVPILF